MQDNPLLFAKRLRGYRAIGYEQVPVSSRDGARELKIVYDEAHGVDAEVDAVDLD